LIYCEISMACFALNLIHLAPCELRFWLFNQNLLVAQVPSRLGPSRAYVEIFSSSSPVVRGPIDQITSITISIAPAINANTPVVSKPFNTQAMRNAVKIAEKWLYE
jgi:hypothetical protein